ncbi:MAG: hypothetical protein AAF411_07015 [Myxococcota bacterium]
MSVDWTLFALSEEELEEACSDWAQVEDAPRIVKTFCPLKLRTVDRLRYVGERPASPTAPIQLSLFPNVVAYRSPYELFLETFQRKPTEEEHAELDRNAYLAHPSSGDSVLRMPTYLLDKLRRSRAKELLHVTDFVRAHPSVFMHAGT